MEMISESTRAAIAWSKMPGLSLRRFWNAFARVGTWEKIAEGDAGLFVEAVGSKELALSLTRPFDVSVSEEVEAARAAGAFFLTPFDDAYPRLLREIPDAPLLLYARGEVRKLALPCVGIVGARAATHYGREAASRLAADLSAAGVCVLSGMARGIDAAAHRAALAGAGGTAAVLGCGVGFVYPPENRDLWRQLEVDGLLLSEYPVAAQPMPHNFPVRNRIIAGISSAVIVVEAASRSGSLITARCANEFGRDVFAVPGSIFSDASSGCHDLLRDGAILCRGAEDVLSEIFPAIGLPGGAAISLPEIAGEAGIVLAEIRRNESCSAEDLAESTKLPADRLLVILFDLEARGYVKPLPGNLFAAVR